MVPLDDLWDIVYETGASAAIYRSVYTYDQEGKDFVDKNRTMKSFMGYRDIDEIPIDIDKGQNTDEYTHKMAKDVVYYIESEYNLKDGNFQCFFSGTGYHIMLAAE